MIKKSGIDIPHFLHVKRSKNNFKVKMNIYLGETY